MSDLIDRQAAMDAMRRLEPSFSGSILEQALKALPSAQSRALDNDALESAYMEGYTLAESKFRAMMDDRPEVVRCKDCICGHGKVWLSGNGEADAYGYCGRTHLRILPYDFCRWAIRREDRL